MNQVIMNAIDAQAEQLSALAKTIWDHPEMGWKEFHAVEETKKYLEANGFEVEVGAYNMPTVIRAVWGKGHPVIGLLGEYDCLPGLSQQVDCKQNPVVEGGDGHGCGHNLLGAGCAGAAIGLKAALEASGKEGTIIFYGCPAEEQLIGKSVMAKQGAFFECDIAAAWHPGTTNENTSGCYTGVRGAYFHFDGKTAHAAGNPQDGRSALDAAQLMNMGVEFLREHCTDDVRIHYNFTDGGLAPNIVPDHACVKYVIRATTPERVEETFDRVTKCAEGAAHMTETKMHIENFGGVNPTLQNRVMLAAMERARDIVPPVEYTEEELAFADAINRTSPLYEEGKTKPITSETVPNTDANNFGSTDCGDVAHIVPTILNVDCTASTLAGGHSWMITACSGHSIGMKGMIRAAKVLAVGCYEMIEHPELIEQAKAEFAESTGNRGYMSMLKDDVPWPYPAD